VLAALVTFLEVARGLLVGALRGELLMLALGYALLFMLPLGAALLVLRGHRFGHLAAIASSLFLIALTGGFLLTVLANPGLPYWASVYLSTCALLAAMVFAALGQLDARLARDARPGRTRFSAATGYMASLMVGIAAGGLVVGLVAGGTIGTLLERPAAVDAEVLIAAGSYLPSNQDAYIPATLTVIIGSDSTVTWYNADSHPHTVTSNTGLFDSGTIPPGGSWTHTFDSPGDFTYYCAPHPWMIGRVIVS
jgi:plastocyanin